MLRIFRTCSFCKVILAIQNSYSQFPEAFFFFPQICQAHSHLRISALSIPSSRMFFGCAGSFLRVQASLVVARWLSSSVACGTLSS